MTCNLQKLSLKRLIDHELFSGDLKITRDEEIEWRSIHFLDLSTTVNGYRILVGKASGPYQHHRRAVLAGDLLCYRSFRPDLPAPQEPRRGSTMERHNPFVPGRRSPPPRLCR